MPITGASPDGGPEEAWGCAARSKPGTAAPGPGLACTLAPSPGGERD